MTQVFLRKVGHDIYQIFNLRDQPMTPARRFDTPQEAIDWAQAWKSCYNYVTVVVEFN